MTHARGEKGPEGRIRHRARGMPEAVEEMVEHNVTTKIFGLRHKISQRIARQDASRFFEDVLGKQQRSLKTVFRSLDNTNIPRPLQLASRLDLPRLEQEA